MIQSWKTRALTGFLASIWCLIAHAQTVTFPGQKPESISPNKRYAIRNEDDEKRSPAHVLIFREAGLQEEHRLYEYDRSVDVLWSPLSNAVVINDHEGSDSSKPVLFSFAKGRNPIDLWPKLIEFLRALHQDPSALKNHHVYFTADRWLDGKSFLCKLTGYGEENPGGFTRYYVFELNKDGFRVARTKR